MREIVVDKISLKSMLEVNLEQHRKIVAAAQAAYKIAAIAALRERIAEFEADKSPNMHFRLSVPEDHSEDYERAIEMLTWSVEKEIDLSQQEFKSYVQNEWGWAGQFAATTEAYLVN